MNNKTNNSVPKCQICENNRQENYCSKCEIGYCNECQDKVHTKEVQPFHLKWVVKVFSDEHNICPTHKKPFLKFCTEHKMLVCEECETNYCWKHMKCICTLQEGKEDLKQETEKVKSQLKLNVLKLKKNRCEIQRESEEFGKEIKTTEEEIKNKYEEMIKEIEKAKRTQLSQLKKIKMITSKLLEKKMSQNEDKLKEQKEMKSDLQSIDLLPHNEQFLRQQISISLTVFDKFKRNSEEEKEKVKGNEKEKVIQNSNQFNLDNDENEQISPNEADRNVIISNDSFDPQWKDKFIKLSSDNLSATKSGKYFRGKGGIVCGKNVYSKGLYEIKIKINNYPMNESNWIKIGVINYSTRNPLPWKKPDFQGLYYFGTYYTEGTKDLSSYKLRICPKLERIPYGKPFKNGDTFHIYLDMDKRTISFGINDENFGVAWTDLPEKVIFWSFIKSQQYQDNQISFI
ncbi:hypothetical protein M0812_30219 [Anaeramoeba flamelloides]|uniref:B30.2/SPRY domain-containing protein n=1 Tax=Anaeramoeba flamelloides TaxID=1746091 RepID=A0AAV7Y699_9EUKA|nr:hypothetical protein M0812_30219 [Anaeramoeba flamelloides]